MRFLLVLVLIALGAAPARARPSATFHLDYVQSWAQPTLGSTAVWNGGDGASAGVDVPLNRHVSVGLEAIYDRFPRESFYSVPGVALVGGGALQMASSLLMVKLVRPGGRGARAFLEAGAGVGSVRQAASLFRAWGATETTRTRGERFSTGAFALGAGYRTRPIGGTQHLEFGVRWLLLPGRRYTVPDEPLRVGVAF